MKTRSLLPTTLDRFLRALHHHQTIVSIALGMISAGFLTPRAQASFHLMQVEQIIGGVEGDVTAQAIQLRMRAHDQSYLHSDDGGPFGPAGLVVSDAKGEHPVTIIAFPHDVKREDAGDTVLIVSPNFAKHVASTLKTDFTMDAIIPASYLEAGRLDYVDGKGDVLWSVSYGGAKYTGPVAAANFNGSFGSPIAQSLPTLGTEALLFQGIATAPSTDNSTDYQQTAPGAIFTNNAGAKFQLLATQTVSLKIIRGEASAKDGSNGLLEVSRNGETTFPLLVHYKTGGSAVGGVEYRHLKGKVTIPEGSQSAKIKIVAKPNDLDEGPKRVKVTLVNGDGYTVDPTGRKAKVKIAGTR